MFRHVKPGTSDALLSQIDLIDSFAALAEATMPTGVAPDSENELPALLGEQPTGRVSLVEQGGGYDIALRQDQWKYIRRPRECSESPAPPGGRRNRSCMT